MALTQIFDHVAKALDRLPYQFKTQENIENLISLYANRTQNVEDIFWELLELRFLEDALGQQLDNLGKILDIEREGLSDDDYRIRLIAKIAQHNSEGTPEDLIAIYSLLMDPDKIEYNEIYPAEFTMAAINANPIGSTDKIHEAILRTKAGGVRLSYLVSTGPNPFVFFGDGDGGGFGSVGNGDGGVLSEII